LGFTYKKIYDETRPPKRHLSDEERSSSENDESVAEINPITQLLSTFTRKSNDDNISTVRGSDESSDEDSSHENEFLAADEIPANSETDDELSEPENTEQQ